MNPQEDRNRVQTLLDVNMVVEAGAGTGKTTLLIDRLCLSVLVQNIPPEKVVALTFTEKAAAEIKTRFMLKLQHLLRALRNAEPDRTLDLLRTHFQLADEVLAQRTEAVLARLDRANIGTIHSFCAEILKTFPLDAGLSPNAQIDTGQKARQIFEIRWNHFLDIELGVHAPQPQRWKKVLAEITLPELKSLAQEMARLKPIPYDYFAHATKLARVCTTQATRAQQLYDLYVLPGKKPRALEKALAWAKTSLQRTADFLTHRPLSPAPEEIAPLATTAYKDWDTVDIEEARALIRFAQTVTPEKQSLFLEAYHLLRPLAETVTEDCRLEGVLSFDDLIIKTRNLLQQNLQIRSLLKEKFDVLFIDEFQDTDPVQGELLLFLAEEKTSAAASWNHVQLQPGKLLVVGDPKQSIYRFRGADITAYEQFTRLILKQGGQKCFLRRNFRSLPEIIETANQICSRAMIQEPAFQPAYEPIFTPDTTQNLAVEWLFVCPDSAQTATADDYRQNQAEQMARWIYNHAGKHTRTNGRVLTLSDIAILTRSATSLHFYMNALRRYGIAFRTETDKDFFRKQEINDFILWLRAIANPADPLALAGVLRSPLGAITDETLFQFSKHGFSLAALAAHPQTKECAALIQHFHQLAGRVTLPTLIHTLLTETFLPEACAAAYDGERTLAHLNQFALWATQYAADGTLESFISELERILAEEPEDLTLPPADEIKDAVSLLTIHKSKGLEFPVVILADLSRKELTAPPPPTHLFSWQYQMYGLRAGKISDVNLAFLEEEQQKHSRYEEIRILYVALTRAKEKLLLVADGRNGAQKAALPFLQAGLFPNGTDSVLRTEQETLQIPVQNFPYLPPKDFIYQPHFFGPEAALPQEPDWAAWARQNKLRQAAYLALRKTALTVSPSELANSPLLTEEQHRAAELGTLCHRTLELLLSTPYEDVTAACTQAARQTGTQNRTGEALALLTPFLNSALFQEIRTCNILACEMPFTLAQADGTIQNGIIDVVLETPSRDIWVLDYKTDQVTSGQEPSLFNQKYRPQLEIYQAAARHIFPGKKVRCSAVFIRTFAAVEL